MQQQINTFLYGIWGFFSNQIDDIAFENFKKY